MFRVRISPEMGDIIKSKCQWDAILGLYREQHKVYRAARYHALQSEGGKLPGTTRTYMHMHTIAPHKHTRTHCFKWWFV